MSPHTDAFPREGTLLAIDASTYAGSVAVVRNGQVLAECTTAMRGEREERLMPAVAESLGTAGVDTGELAGIVCGAGPGSFTSLRIAAAIAKGLAMATGAPLFAVPSPVLIVAGAAERLHGGHYLAVLDAMRGDVHAMHVELLSSGALAVHSGAMLIPRAALDDEARVREALVIGPGEAIDAAPHARGTALLGDRLASSAPVDLASWEPVYGRLAEAQVKWERAHGRPLPTA